jgi:uncharacterized protein
MTATRTPLALQRWHFQHGPIDLIIGAEGDASAVHAAHNAAWLRFQGLLAELVAELPALRAPVSLGNAPEGAVAKKMFAACRAFSPQFITPMAAVAGAVADEIINSYRTSGVTKAWVNNGGDIAFHLAPGSEDLRLAVVADPHLARFVLPRGLMQHDGLVRIAESSMARGVATSGWNGRSFSMGIADAVTVLAKTAAEADAAATIIGNAVNVASALITRAPATTLRDDSDLGDRLVTVHVPRLPVVLVAAALTSGLNTAQKLHASGLIVAALLQCQGQVRWLGAQTGFETTRRADDLLRYAAAMTDFELPADLECAA